MSLSKFTRIQNLLFIVALFLFVSCSKTVRFAVSPVVPSAEGSISLGKDDNNNRLMVLKVRNLVDPSRLTPPRKIYVVWLQTKSAGVKNLGRLVSSEAYFSTERNAKFSTIIPSDATKVFITAEENVGVTYPSGVTVLTTQDF